MAVKRTTTGPALAKEINALISRVDSLWERSNGNAVKLSILNDEQEAIHKDVRESRALSEEALKQAVQTRTEVYSRRTDNQTTLDGLSKHVFNNTNKLNECEQRLTEQAQRICTLESQVNQYEGRLDVQRDRITALENRLNALDKPGHSHFGTMPEQLASFDQRLTRHERMLCAHSEAMGMLDAKLRIGDDHLASLPLPQRLRVMSHKHGYDSIEARTLCEAAEVLTTYRPVPHGD